MPQGRTRTFQRLALLHDAVAIGGLLTADGCASRLVASRTRPARLVFEATEQPSEPGLALNICTVAAGTPTADVRKLLASWAASQRHLLGETHVAT